MSSGAEPCDFPGADAQKLQAFLDAGCYLHWVRDPEIRNSGPVIDGVPYFTHGRVRSYYSPEIYQWLLGGRPEGGIPEGAMIVKENYPPLPEEGDKLSLWTTMVRLPGGSWDGWFWSSYAPGPPTHHRATFGYSACIGCHASADRPELTFAALRNIHGDPENYDTPDPTWAIYTLHGAIAPRDPDPLPQPLTTPDAGFLRLFSQLPALSASQIVKLPDSALDHVVSGRQGPLRFLTSDQCVGCHNASALLENVPPHMLAMDQRGGRVNLSPYGEWSASLMGLAGRDPVFHAQLESETVLRPSITGFLENTCYRCHGVMGQRQIHLDSGDPFTHAMVYAVGDDRHARYGALARDGVSCAGCHAMSAQGLGTAASYTGQFNVASPDELYGPYADPKTYPMGQALGITPVGGDHMGSSALCGSCHTVILPQVPSAYTGSDPMADSRMTFEHEQTTYLEWRNSAYQNEMQPINHATARTCQQCHMPQTFEGRKLAFRIANIEDEQYPHVDNRAPDEEIALTEREPFGRHTLVGLNVFVMQMFQQFISVLGIPAFDRLVPRDTVPNLKTAEASALQLAREETVRLDIRSVDWTAERLDVLLRVTNLAGHKFPSGVGFRRAFIEFSVLDTERRVLWTSGRTSPYGVIIDGATGQPLATEFSKTAWEPHHQIIDRQDVAQIYEERHLDDRGELTTSFVALFRKVKDNRLLPLGWRTDGPDIEHMRPVGIDGDPLYADGSGSDELRYRVPLAAIPHAASVEARLFYQSIPPYYLRDRFETAAGPETQRLHYLASRLNVAGTAIEGWRLEVASSSRQLTPPAPAARARPG